MLAPARSRGRVRRSAIARLTAATRSRSDGRREHSPADVEGAVARAIARPPRRGGVRRAARRRAASTAARVQAAVARASHARRVALPRRRGRPPSSPSRSHARADARRPGGASSTRQQLEAAITEAAGPAPHEPHLPRRPRRAVPRAPGNRHAAAHPRGHRPDRPHPRRVPSSRSRSSTSSPPMASHAPPSIVDPTTAGRRHLARRPPSRVGSTASRAHGTRRAFEADRARDRALRLAGARVVRPRPAS